MRQLGREVLTGPVFVVATRPPQSAFGYIINNPAKSDPNLGFILSVP